MMSLVSCSPSLFAHAARSAFDDGFVGACASAAVGMIATNDRAIKAEVKRCIYFNPPGPLGPAQQE